MTIRQRGLAAATSSPQDSSTVGPIERRQREWELSEAVSAARSLQARLELVGDRQRDVAVIHSLRDSLARDLAALAEPEIPYSGDWLADAIAEREREQVEP